MRIDRLLAITVILLNRKRISAKELAERFEISVRTVYRDIEAINFAGIPIISYSGNNGGFGIIDTYKLDKHLLTLKDTTAILSALKGVNKTLGDQKIDSAIEKITNLVPKEKTDELEDNLNQMVIDIMPYGYQEKQKQLIQSFHNAIISRNLVEFDYRNVKNEYLRRTVEPITVILQGYTWYLHAYCTVKNDFRLFRFSRIKKDKVLTGQYFIRKNKEYTGLEIPLTERNKEIDLVLEFSSSVRYRVEEYFDEKSITLLENGNLKVLVTFPEDEWIYSFLLGYGENVKIISPLHVKENLYEKTKKMLINFQK